MTIIKQAAQNFDGESFNLLKIIELEFKKQYQIEITNRFAVFESLIVDDDIYKT